MSSDTILGWHFTGETLRDGRAIPPIGEALVHTGTIVPCSSGLHAGVRPWHALQYAPGPLLHRVELSGDLRPHGTPTDKYVGRQRIIIESHNVTDLLRRFACDQALSVLPADAPQILRDYLENPSEDKRDAARDAARMAARATARMADEAARPTAWEAARETAWAVAWNTAWEAAWAVRCQSAREFAWEAVRGSSAKTFDEMVAVEFGL